METRLYKCEYCKKDFLPARRKVQKFCSTSCRVKAHHQKTKMSLKLMIPRSEKQTGTTSIDKMSFAGVGNAAIGTAAVDLLKLAFTSEENKPATKKDVQNLATKLERFQRVQNMNPNSFGRFPYFDRELSVLVYR